MASLFPEICYEWTRSQDVASQHLEVVRRGVQGVIISGGSFLELEVYNVPRDRAFVLQSVVGSAICNDATCIINHLAVSTSSSFDFPFVTANPPSAPGVAGVIRAVSWTGQHLVPPGRQLTVRIGMQTVMIADQLVVIGLSGISIPRGNILEA